MCRCSTALPYGRRQHPLTICFSMCSRLLWDPAVGAAVQHMQSPEKLPTGIPTSGQLFITRKGLFFSKEWVCGDVIYPGEASETDLSLNDFLVHWARFHSCAQASGFRSALLLFDCMYGAWLQLCGPQCGPSSPNTGGGAAFFRPISPVY